MIKEFFRQTLYLPLFNLLIFFAWLVPGHSIGWAIVMLTILVRIILWAPQSKALRSPLELRAHQPELKAIQERYKDDKMAQQQATLAFYKEKGINPFSGCLPILIQLPVMLILYRVFQRGLSEFSPSLLYPFTPHPTSINPDFYGINMAEPSTLVMPLFAALAQFAQSYQMSKLQSPVSTDKNDPTVMMNKQMLYIFPAMTFFIGRSFPAGLTLYWGVNAIFALGQQYFVAKTFKEKHKSAVSVTVRQKSDRVGAKKR